MTWPAARRPPPAARDAADRNPWPTPAGKHCRNQSGNTMSGGAGRPPVPRRVRRLPRARRAEPEGEGEGEGEGGPASSLAARRPPRAMPQIGTRGQPPPRNIAAIKRATRRAPGPTSRVHVVSIFVAAPEASIAAAATAVRAAHSRAGSQADPARRVAARRGAASWAGLGGARETRAVRVAVSSARHAARGGRRRSALEMKSMRGCHRREHCRNQIAQHDGRGTDIPRACRFDLLLGTLVVPRGSGQSGPRSSLSIRLASRPGAVDGDPGRGGLVGGARWCTGDASGSPRGFLSTSRCAWWAVSHHFADIGRCGWFGGRFSMAGIGPTFASSSSACSPITFISSSRLAVPTA